jgi:hypothetical protein
MQQKASKLNYRWKLRLNDYHVIKTAVMRENLFPIFVHGRRASVFFRVRVFGNKMMKSIFKIEKVDRRVKQNSTKKFVYLPLAVCMHGN